MEIISHRGYWSTDNDKNSEVSFRRSFFCGYGTETDVRDCNGELVISHDLPNGSEVLFEDFLRTYKSYHQDLPLALNVKADGLAKDILKLLNMYSIHNYFLFDMSVPDMITYLNLDMNIYVRYSEYEEENNLWGKATGIWFDGFKSLNFELEQFKKWVEEGKKICIVSPELHSRDVTREWLTLKEILQELGPYSDSLMLCTDNPDDAKGFFNA
jgi:glycerophosphoryl diester phosphodiesterase